MLMNQGSRWPTSGVAIARYTRGSTHDGPGVNMILVGGRSSPTDSFMDMTSQNSAENASSLPKTARSGQPPKWLRNRYSHAFHCQRDPAAGKDEASRAVRQTPY